MKFISNLKASIYANQVSNSRITKKESAKSEEVVTPKAAEQKNEKVTAKAEDLLSNYIKGAINNFSRNKGVNSGVNSGANNRAANTGNAGAAVQAAALQGAGRDGEDVQALIEQWNNLPEDATFEVKIELLGQIIDIFAEQGDTTNENIWRIRRYTTAMQDNTSQYLEMLQNQSFDNIPSSVYTIISYTDDNQDREALNNCLSVSDNDRTPEQNVVIYEYLAKIFKNFLLYHLVKQNDPNSNFDYSSQIENDSHLLYVYTKRVVENNASMADAPWQDTFNNLFKPKFESFQGMMRDSNNPVHTAIMTGNPITNKEKIITVDGLVADLNTLIDRLRSEGFPYCDELLISIQGYLVYAGHNDFDVLPYPEND